MLPFSRDQFLAVFAAYNAHVWPAQLVAYAVAAFALWGLERGDTTGRRSVGAALALMWLWTGVAYHGLHFARINPAAWAFGALFVLQAGLLVQATWRGALRFEPQRHAAWIGGTLMLYAMVLYPLVGLAAGEGYPAMPMFGITPCPLALFTWGVLLRARRPLARRVVLVPLLWSLVGGSAAYALDMPQDWPLLLSAGVGVWLLLQRKPRPVAAPHA